MKELLKTKYRGFDVIETTGGDFMWGMFSVNEPDILWKIGSACSFSEVCDQIDNYIDSFLLASQSK